MSSIVKEWSEAKSKEQSSKLGAENFGLKLFENA